MPIESYKNGMSYEIFICRAFKDLDNRKNGAHLSNMRNLIDAENGESFVSHLPNALKQLATVKQYMTKAIDKYLKNKLTDLEKESLSELKNRTEKAGTSSELLDIIEEGLLITDRLK